MICPICGKLSSDSNSLCMYCGTARVQNPPLFRDAGKFRDHPEEQAGRVYEIHDTTEFEWGRFAGGPVAGSRERDEQRHTPVEQNEVRSSPDTDAEEPSPASINEEASIHDEDNPAHSQLGCEPALPMPCDKSGGDDDDCGGPEDIHLELTGGYRSPGPDIFSEAPSKPLHVVLHPLEQPPDPAGEPSQPSLHMDAGGRDNQKPESPSPSPPGTQDQGELKPQSARSSADRVSEMHSQNPEPQQSCPDAASGTSSAPKKRMRLVSEAEMLRTALAGKYDIIRPLGTGGMATVYLAHEIALDRDVAIKVLPQAFIRDKQFVNRFKREARMAARLEHPNIVRIYCIGEEPGLCYFVMSFIPGGTIAERVKANGPLPAVDIARWGIDVCSALGYAHERGVIHRDLKPDNIMLDFSGRAIVMDFGIAHAAEGTNLTRSGALIGTPQYMSPDQAMGRTLDARSDIYSFGMVLYKMTAGKLPFKSKDPLSLMYMHVNKTPQSPDVLNPGTPRWLRDIILTCIAKNPEDRFSSAYDLRDALSEGESFVPRIPLPIPQDSPSPTGSGLIGTAVNFLSGALSGFRIKR